MNSNDPTLERVRELADRADRLRMQSVAIPLKELKALVQLCDQALEQKYAWLKAESEVD
ncbi:MULTISPECIES: hypothetical protein [unclassified Caballeronia]|jgi:hypothetical protein|uniref:hypothetical protein n=1 Tax=unclassified Caballeronia TaxID=2646786 RepID=UPI001FD2A0C4|nr:MULTISPECIES: hypothetical protein [unclassified Caballeronia]MDR5800935.1 hypothetical protein [Caballeronia sp. LZ001]